MSERTEPTCIDLKERYGETYKVRSELDGGKAIHDPWHAIILCDHGHIYPHGGNMLGASTNKRGGIARRLMALPFTEVLQDGDDGINAIFHVDRLPEILKLLKVKNRVRLSPERRAESAERLRKLGAKYRFKPGQNQPKTDE